jgi:glutamate formiminotransferase
MALECVVNISEGRRAELLDSLADRLRRHPDVYLLHQDRGWDANRTVFTLAGTSEGLVQALTTLASDCLEHLDMRTQSGIHPRIGALDVCPIVPLDPASEGEAHRTVAALAKAFSQLGIGGWFYAQSAVQPGFDLLANVRKGDYEGVAARVSTFDFGQYQARFGAMALGVRPFLLAYNINVTGLDLGQVKRVAKNVRESSPGGLPGLRAIGWDSPEFGCMQVSCNIVDLNRCTPKQLFERVASEVALLGGQTMGSELIGLSPAFAFSDYPTMNAAIAHLGLDALEPFDPQVRILENLLPATLR